MQNAKVEMENARFEMPIHGYGLHFAFRILNYRITS